MASATRATAISSAACRSVCCDASARSHMASKERPMIRRRRTLTSSSAQKSCWRSCTHSKYETITPPALHRMSGTTVIPRWARMRSASGVVGPLAPSAISLQRSRPAFAAVICPSIAAGTRTSHSSSRRSALEMGVALREAGDLPHALGVEAQGAYVQAAPIVDAPLRVAYGNDLAADLVQQAGRHRRRCQSSGSPPRHRPGGCAGARRPGGRKGHPKVADGRPSDPPRLKGLPVTTPGTV